MTSEAPFPDDTHLDAPLDGALDRRSDSDIEGHRDEAAFEDRIDGTLRRYFAAPQPPAELFDAIAAAAAEAESETHTAEMELEERVNAALRRQFAAPQPPPELFDAVAAAAAWADSEMSEAEIELQDRVDAALQRQFAVPEPPRELIDAVTFAAAPTERPRALRRGAGLVRRVLRSAVAVVVSVGLWLLFIYHQWFQEPTSVAAAPSNPASVSDIFDTLVHRGFVPDAVLQDEQQLAQTLLSRHGQSVEVRPLPENVHLLGLAHLNGLRNTTTVLMCRVDDQPVVVFIGHRVFRLGPERFRNPLRTNAFDWNAGRLWALELTPHDEPRVIDLLVSAPDRAGEADVESAAEGDGGVQD